MFFGSNCHWWMIFRCLHLLMYHSWGRDEAERCHGRREEAKVQGLGIGRAYKFWRMLIPELDNWMKGPFYRKHQLVFAQKPKPSQWSRGPQWGISGFQTGCMPREETTTYLRSLQLLSSLVLWLCFGAPKPWIFSQFYRTWTTGTRARIEIEIGAGTCQPTMEPFG